MKCRPSLLGLLLVSTSCSLSPAACGTRHDPHELRCAGMARHSAAGQHAGQQAGGACFLPASALHSGCGRSRTTIVQSEGLCTLQRTLLLSLSALRLSRAQAARPASARAAIAPTMPPARSTASGPQQSAAGAEAAALPSVAAGSIAGSQAPRAVPAPSAPTIAPAGVPDGGALAGGAGSCVEGAASWGRPASEGPGTGATLGQGPASPRTHACRTQVPGPRQAGSLGRMHWRAWAAWCASSCCGRAVQTGVKAGSTAGASLTGAQRTVEGAVATHASVALHVHLAGLPDAAHKPRIGSPGSACSPARPARAEGRGRAPAEQFKPCRRTGRRAGAVLAGWRQAASTSRHAGTEWVRTCWARAPGAGCRPH